MSEKPSVPSRQRVFIIEHRSLAVEHDRRISLDADTDESHWRRTRRRSCSPAAQVDRDDGIVWTELLVGAHASDSGQAGKRTEQRTRRHVTHGRQTELARRIPERGCRCCGGDHFTHCLESELIWASHKVGDG